MGGEIFFLLAANYKKSRLTNWAGVLNNGAGVLNNGFNISPRGHM